MSSIEYLVGERRFLLDYADLRGRHRELCGLTDAEFVARAPEALHLACVVSWLKGRSEHALADDGCVHELAHLIHLGAEYLKPAREAFERECALA